MIVEPKEYGHSRDDIYNALAENGIHARKYFYPLVTEYDCYKSSFDSQKTPIASEISRRVITLPFYADIEEKTVINICDIIYKLEDR